MSNKNFKNKYNFNIDEQERAIYELIEKFKPIKRHEYRLTIIDNYNNLEINYVKKPITFKDKLETKKIQYDSLTTSQVLKKKVLLNFRLMKIFFYNFYSDEFNRTRKSIYLIFTLPFFVGGTFYILSPVHPVRGLAFNLSIFISLVNMGYNYITDIDDILINDYEMSEEVKPA
jgi:hypothetical protein